MKRVTEMDIVVVGVSYKNTPIEIREQLSFSKKKLEAAYLHLKEILDEVVILSTCNRSEIYAVSEHGSSSIEMLKDFFSDFHGVEKDRLANYFYSKENRECVEHLFMVASGLDSQVLGEDQILGQVKTAYETALEKEATGKFFNRLFRDSITAGKKIRRETRISQNPTSISYIAVQYLVRVLDDLPKKTVLLVGAGKMNRLALTYLKEKGFGQVIVANRTPGAAESFKEIDPSLQVVPFRRWEEYLPSSDVVISSTSAPHLVIRKEKISQYKRGIYLIDLAVPRDIDPAIGRMEGINLIDLDILEKVVAENQEKRQQAGEKARAIVDRAVEDFCQWLKCIPLFPVIRQIEQYHENVLEREMPKLVGRLKNAPDEAQIEVLLKGFLKKIYSGPVLRLKEYSRQENPETCACILEALYGEESR